MPDYGTELRSRLGMGRYRDRRAGFRDYHLRAGQGSRGYEREMLSNGYSRRLRGGWQRGYDWDYQGRGGYMGDRDYSRNRASAAYEQDYVRPGPAYGLRGSTSSPREYGW